MSLEQREWIDVTRYRARSCSSRWQRRRMTDGRRRSPTSRRYLIRGGKGDAKTMATHRERVTGSPPAPVTRDFAPCETQTGQKRKGRAGGPRGGDTRRNPNGEENLCWWGKLAMTLPMRKQETEESLFEIQRPCWQKEKCDRVLSDSLLAERVASCGSLASLWHGQERGGGLGVCKSYGNSGKSWLLWDGQENARKLAALVLPFADEVFSQVCRVIRSKEAMSLFRA